MDHTVVNAPAPHFGVFVFRDLWHKTPAAIGCGGLLSGSPPSVLVSDPTTAKPEKSSEAAHSREHRQRDQRLMLPDLGSRERRPHSAEQWPKTKRMCLALLPLAATLLVLRGLTMTIAHALGLGPLLG